MTYSPEQWDQWVKVFYNYGPFAFAVLLLVVAEVKLRRVLSDALTGNKPPWLKMLSGALYTSNWILFIILVFISVSAWAHRGAGVGVAVIKGTLTHTLGQQTLYPPENLFVSARYLGSKRIPGSYDWLLVTNAPVADGYKLTFALQQTLAHRDETSYYDLVIHPQYYGKDVELVYDREKHVVNVQLGGRNGGVLEPYEASLPQNGTQQHIAYAQEPFKAADFVDRLESNDPFIRRDARKDLAVRGRQAIPWIESVLTNPKSNYRLRLGVLVALNNMKDPTIGELTPATQVAIIEATTVSGAATDYDETLRGAALAYIGFHATPTMEDKFNQIFAAARAAENTSSLRVHLLARTGLTVFYNRGIALTFAYRRPSDTKTIQTAIAEFSNAWSLHTLAIANDQIYFPKALWGWGLALNQISKVDKLPDRAKDAQDKFREFLKAVPNPQKYPYPNQIRDANRYLKDPAAIPLQPT